MTYIQGGLCSTELKPWWKYKAMADLVPGDNGIKILATNALKWNRSSHAAAMFPSSPRVSHLSPLARRLLTSRARPISGSSIKVSQLWSRYAATSNPESNSPFKTPFATPRPHFTYPLVQPAPHPQTNSHPSGTQPSSRLQYPLTPVGIVRLMEVMRPHRMATQTLPRRHAQSWYRSGTTQVHFGNKVLSGDIMTPFGTIVPVPHYSC